MKRVKHIKRGSTYRVLGEAKFQVSTGQCFDHMGQYRAVHDKEPVTVYRSEDDGQLYARFPDEMGDGRFEELPDDTPVLFGLEQQGHIPTIENMLREGRDWPFIGRAINWEPSTAKAFYERYLERRASQPVQPVATHKDDCDYKHCPTRICDCPTPAQVEPGAAAIPGKIPSPFLIAIEPTHLIINGVRGARVKCTDVAFPKSMVEITLPSDWGQIIEPMCYVRVHDGDDQFLVQLDDKRERDGGVTYFIGGRLKPYEVQPVAEDEKDKQIAEMRGALAVAEEALENYALGGKDDGTLDVVRKALGSLRTDPPAKDVTRYIIGEATAENVFKAAGLKNLSNLQAVFDAVEAAMTRPQADLTGLQKALAEANSLLRSGYAIATRKGEGTNWEPYAAAVRQHLVDYHTLSLEAAAATSTWPFVPEA